MSLRPALSSLASILAAVRSATGMSSAEAGALTTLPILCFGLFAPLAPRLARRFSAERVILYCLLALATSVGLRNYFGIPGLFIGTLVAGGGIGVVMVLLPSLIKRDFPQQTALMTGVYTTALSLGAALAAGMTVPIQDMTGGDWRPALAFWMLPALLAAWVWWPQIRGRSPQDGRVRYTVQGLTSSLLAWQITAYMGLQSTLAYCVFGWLPTILVDRGIAPLAVGFVLSVSITAQLVTSLGGPWLATRGRDQRAAILLMLGMSVVGLLGCMYAPIEILWPWAIVLGLGQGGNFSIALTLIVLRTPNPHVVASLSGMTQGVGYTVAALGPLAVGILHDASRSWNMVAVLFLLICGAVLLAGMGAGRNRYVEAKVNRVS